MDSFTAIFDACVLYPAPLRDFLVRLAVAGLFRAKWKDAIHDEWIRNLLARRPELDPARLAITRARLNAHAEGSLVTGYEALIPSLTLPDPNDRHVLAAAIAGSASVIVTFNLDDFPTQVLRPFGIEPQHPDDFIANLFDLDEVSVCNAFRQQRQALKNPPQSVNELLQTLERQRLPQTVAVLRQYARLL